MTPEESARYLPYYQRKKLDREFEEIISVKRWVEAGDFDHMFDSETKETFLD